MRTLADREETDTDRRAATTEQLPTRSHNRSRSTSPTQKSGRSGYEDSNDFARPRDSQRSRRKSKSTLIYCMGDAADDILHSFKLTEADSKVYETVKEKFESHFVKRRNVIFERVKFNNRKQE